MEIQMPRSKYHPMILVGVLLLLLLPLRGNCAVEVNPTPRNCGPYNICVPDLRLKVTTFLGSFLMGSPDKIYLDIEVHNNGEDAYESMMYMTVPQSLAYVNFYEKKRDPRWKTSNSPILCTPNNNTLQCDIGNPLPTFHSTNFTVIFQPRLSPSKPSFDFHVTVDSSNPEEMHSLRDNMGFISIPIRLETDLKVFGVSKEATLLHNPSEWKQLKTSEEYRSETEIGPEFFHIYDIKCQGPSLIESAEVTIIWPSYLPPSTPGGESRHFLYLLEQPLVDGPGECDFVPHDVNPLHLALLEGRWENIIPDTTSLGEERRNKRGVEDYEDWSRELGCGPTECIKINCRINKLTSGSSVRFFLRSRVFSKTIVEEFHGDIGVDVSSKLVARVTELPYNVDPGYLKYKVYDIQTKINEVPKDYNLFSKIEEDILSLSVPSVISGRWRYCLVAAIVGIFA